MTAHVAHRVQATRTADQPPARPTDNFEDCFKRLRVWRSGIAKQRGIAAYYHQQVVEIVRDPAGKLTDSFHSLGLPQRSFRLLAFLDLEMKASIASLKFTGAFVHYCLDATSVAGTEQQQRPQEAGADYPCG